MALDMTSIPDVVVVNPRVFEDDRGLFIETYRSGETEDLLGFSGPFVQDNHSYSKKGVLRGLHYQITPRAQGKLVWVVRGAVFDVAVDIRQSSATFRQWFGVELSADNHQQLWVPPGFAHGFLSLSEPADLLYKVTDYYSPEHDRTIRWDDPDLGIEWPLDGTPILSEKDSNAPYLADAEVFA